jgi:hypothetical protein
VYDCVPNTTYESIKENNMVPNGCGTNIGYFFCMSFILFVTLIFLNLFIAIILQGFADINDKENLFLNDTSVEHFSRKWSYYDPEGEGFIKIEDLPLLFYKIGPPLGFDAGKFQTRKLQNEFISLLKLPTYKTFKCYYFYDVLTSLAKI